ncbi:TPA: hypothetical protein ACXPQL_004117 [Salmonella enterica]
MSKGVMKLGNHNGAAKVIAEGEKVKPARLQMNIHPDMHKALVELCFNRTDSTGKRLEMSEQVLTMVYVWMEQEGVEVSPTWLMKPKDW